MYSVRPPFLAKLFFSKAIWRMNKNEKSIYLTFDDGPIPEVTPWVLKILKEYNAKATFFCIGENIKNHPGIFQSIIDEGHSIGNHTHSHINGWKTSNEKYLKEVEECNQQIFKFSNFQIKLFRPPYGRMKCSQYSLLNSQFSIIMWDVLSGDFDHRTTPEKCLENVISKTRNGSIVVFHDSIKAKEKLYYALPEFLKHFKEKRFEFKAL